MKIAEMSISAILIAAKAKIAQESSWTQKVYMRDATGHDLFFDSHNFDRACSYCSLGAVQAASPSGMSWDMGGVGPKAVLQYLIDAVPEEFKDEIKKTEQRDLMWGYVSNYNDTHTHADVTAMYDRAIEAALKDGV